MLDNVVEQYVNDHLNGAKVEVLSETFDDRTLNPRGWQYKKYGNSHLGADKLKQCEKEMDLIEDSSKCARNDSDPRYFKKLLFKKDNTLVYVGSSPSRSGNSVSYNFTTIKAI